MVPSGKAARIGGCRQIPHTLNGEVGVRVDILFFRHPGLDPGAIHPALREWIPDQVRDDDGEQVCFCSKPGIL
jgi:hypothetical protein